MSGWAGTGADSKPFVPENFTAIGVAKTPVVFFARTAETFRE
jgi:hypothetical protein